MENFLKNFAEQFDETPAESFTPDTKFKELEEWSSMLALSVIAMIDEKYGKKLTGTALRSAETVSDLEHAIENGKE